jgi:CheY-like chemotaxis protein
MPEGTIFAIDDEQDNLTFISAVISDAGYRAETSTDGATALDKMKASPPVLVFLDVQMPGMNGFQVLEAIRSAEALAGTPVVFLSAIGAVTGEDYDVDTIEARYGVRPDGFLPKPIDAERIVAEIRRLLGK